MRLEAFLEPAGVSGLQPCAPNPPKKGLVPGSSDWWDVRQIQTRPPSVATSFIGTHFDRLCWAYTDLVGCVLVSGGSRLRCALTGILESQGAVPLDSNPPWRGWVHRPAPEAPFFRGTPTGPKALLEPLGASGLQPSARTRLKKRLVPHSSGRWDCRRISRVCRDNEPASHPRASGGLSPGL